MRLILSLIAAFMLAAAVPMAAEAAGPVKTVAKGTATVGKGVARGTVRVGKGVARGTGRVAKATGKGVCRVFTLGRRC